MRKVTVQDAAHFGNVWRHSGVAIPMQDVHYQFASDFANIVLQSFIEDAQRQAAKAALAQQKKLVVVQQ